MTTAFTGSDREPIVHVTWGKGPEVEVLDVEALVRRYRADWASAVCAGRISQEAADLDIEWAVEELLAGRVAYWAEPSRGCLRLESLDVYVCPRPMALRAQWEAWQAADRSCSVLPAAPPAATS